MAARYQGELHVDTNEVDRAFKYLDLFEIGEKGIPLLDWLIDGWLVRKDVAIVAGWPYTGKTTLVFDLAVALASGRAWCGITPTTKGPVLVFDEEQGEDLTARLFLRLGAKGVENLRIASGQGVNLATADGFARLAREIERVRPIVVMLDSETQVFVGIDENDAGEVAAVFNRLFQLRDTFGVTVLIVHHLRKPPSQGKLDLLHLVRGSTAWVAQASTVWVARKNGRTLELTQAKRRGSKPTSLRIGYAEEGDDGRITLTGEGRVEDDETGIERARKAALQFVSDRGEAKTAEIQSALQADGFNYKAVSRALTHLCGQGQLSKSSHGRYRLAEPEGQVEDAGDTEE